MDRPKRTGHIDALDGLRGLAAAIVLIGHVNAALATPATVLDSIRHGPLAILISGSSAVHLFFILSGFCLAASASRSTSISDLAQYFVRRVFRIHPPYMFALLATWGASFFYDTTRAAGGLTPWMLGLASVHVPVADLLLYLAWPGTAGKQLPVAWSMAVEMVYSLALPTMMWLTRRSHWTLLLMISAWPMFDLDFQPSILKFGFQFTLGIALHIERERLSAWFARVRGVRAVAFVAAGLALFGANTALGLHYRVSGPFVSAAGGTALVCAALFIPGVRTALSARALVYFGRISYSFYLLHFTVLILVSRMIRGPASLQDASLLLLGSFVATTLCAALTHRIVERPSIALGNSICRRVARSSGGAVRLSGLVP